MEGWAWSRLGKGPSTKYGDRMETLEQSDLTSKAMKSKASPRVLETVQETSAHTPEILHETHAS
jgi:hypothetical protein